MNTNLLDILICDRCGQELFPEAGMLICSTCDRRVPIENGKPVFTPYPEGLQPSPKITRDPHTGTPWRRANWQFLERQIRQLDPQALILDVGAGRGDFAALFAGRNYLALDIYPYPEVDLVGDLTLSNPLRAGSLGALVLMNVLEHVYDTHALLATLASALKPGGKLIIAVPFMVKMHQIPIDYLRFTHFTLERLGQEHNLELEHLEGYYDPVFFLGEGLGNLKNAVLPTIKGSRHYLGRGLLLGIEWLVAGLQRITGPGKCTDPKAARSLAPTGYHVVYRKPD